MNVLGIETSCDDTGVAVVRDGHEILVNLVASQEDHARFGGVVPEIAARKHVEVLPALLEAALGDAGLDLSDLDGIAVTRGPGLIGALLAGWCFGRGVAEARGLPYVGVHHLAAHVHGALMPAIGEARPIAYPLMALVVSGGHTALYRVTGNAGFLPVGKTRDDAAGEAYDKVSKLLELGYPGGPVIDELAVNGDPQAWDLPRSDLGLDFTFSGLKSAVRRAAIEASIEPGDPANQRILDLVASFQAAVIDMLAATTERALNRFTSRGLVLCGGVAANRSLRARFESLASRRNMPLYVSPPRLATDNGAMIAGAGYRRLAAGDRDPLDLAARATWPLGS
ncbi:MAG: tRNA (adenosine(37)-N6)-threonylcarbamoyltransferase complex transferase subunit TsaD [Acidobacteria bacterium]|nr:tRNA (adenosine(37)-N6)-threonylcarbamoyltransferase complex transferase subunit TsaD [Acidobacteriota bacterium]